MKALLLPLLLAACGSPFTEAPELLGSTPDAGHTDHSDAALLPDAGHDSSTDSSQGVDSSAGDSGPSGHDADTSHDADSSPPPEDTGCTLHGTASAPCAGDTITVPGEYCVLDTTEGTGEGAAMPGACRCKATYTCKCLVSTVALPADLCKASQIYAGCDDSAGFPQVKCEDP